MDKQATRIKDTANEAVHLSKIWQNCTAIENGKPTYYHVLFDENGFTANILQVLTNSLCYTYVSTSFSIILMPPAYYAHLAAFRARYYIEDEMSDSGSTRRGRKPKNKVVEVRQLPSIKDNVKEVMFYI
ncbi:hypothetical protein ES288_A10G156800v1 [Gossypium darwinii]|uniref:Piwi domain-containing protein n=1 Tax=Gossypium darwinii TaxID=34276 RepID=A0A5D2EZP6_GOSDA|nr:hypothetical protein ES288_A10G156800v1 [Gossypium darwinii]